jgi:7-carboxy-7-deazaguanine synthase
MGHSGVSPAPTFCALPRAVFSPVQGQLEAGQLAQWIIDDKLPVRFQLQLHKVLWGNTPGR